MPILVPLLTSSRWGGRLMLASGLYDETVRLWDRTSGKALATLRGHIGRVTSFCAFEVGLAGLCWSQGRTWREGTTKMQ